MTILKINNERNTIEWIKIFCNIYQQANKPTNKDINSLIYKNNNIYY